jgi:hypothetical protein
VFTAALELIVAMALTDGRLGLAAICAGLAATQNPPVGLLLVVAISLFILRLGYALYRGDRTSALALARSAGPLCVAGVIVSLMPVIFYEATLGVPNPIIAGGAADPRLVGMERVLSLAFDLNQGLIVGAPGVLLLIAVALLEVLRPTPVVPGANQVGALRRAWPLVAGLALFVAMALPTTATTYWNHGQTVMSRYAYWLAVPLVVGSVSVLKASPRRLLPLLLVVGLVQVASLTMYDFWGKNWRGNYLSMKPQARLVLRRMPAIYNPVPAVFMERAAGTVQALTWQKGIQVFVYPEPGRVTKALVSEQNLESLASVFQPCGPMSISRGHEGWAYISLDHPCSPAWVAIPGVSVNGEWLGR